MRGADEIANRPFAIEVPGGYTGKGRVVLFSNNPIYRWQNHAEFNMVFNSHDELERHGRRPSRRPRGRPPPADAKRQKAKGTRHKAQGRR